MQATGVLELVDEDVAEARAIVFAQRFVALQEFERAQQQLGEVDRAFAPALLVVQAEQLGEAALRLVVRLHHRGAQTGFLGIADEVLQIARAVTLLVDILRFHQTLDRGELVLAVQDLERLRQAGRLVVDAQQPIAQAVERADPHAAQVHRQHRRHASEHLARCLVGERHRQDAAGGRAPGLDQPGDACRQHARLAAAGAGEDEDRPVGHGDGFELAGIETFEERLEHRLPE